MRSRRLVAALVLGLALGLLTTLLLMRADDRATSTENAADRPAATKSRAPSTTTAPSGATASTEQFPSTGPTASAPRIETTSLTYFGRPFETIHIRGRYWGVPGPTALRVQVHERDGWTQYPLPAVTKSSGQFRAFVDLGEPGEYQLRIVDPTKNHASKVVTLLVF